MPSSDSSRSLALRGIGLASPEHALPTSDALAMAQHLCCESEKDQRLAGALFRRSGVEQRQLAVDHRLAYEWADRPHGPSTGERMQLFENHAADLAERSARAALEAAETSAGEVTHLVTVCCTGFESPGVDFALINRLGLSPDTQRVNVGFMGCHAAINGLRVAAGLAAASTDAVVLLSATELCSLHYSWGWDPNRLVGNAIFGDGSASLVGKSVAAGEDEGTPRLADTASRLLPDTADLMSWRVGDHGFEMMLSAELPGVIEQHLAGWIGEWLRSHGLGVEDVGAWAVHPGGPRIVAAVETALGLSPTQTQVSRDVLRDHGNMSSPTVLFVTKRLLDAGAKPPIVMLGFGPGIVAEAALWL